MLLQEERNEILEKIEKKQKSMSENKDNSPQILYKITKKIFLRFSL